MKIRAVFVLSLLGLFSFSTKKDNYYCARSGIKGHVYLISGNQMPSPDQPARPPAGMQTTLYIYELTNLRQVTREGSSAFYTEVSTKLIKEVKTKADGSFTVKLKPGTYSLFVKTGGKFYANLFDGDNNIYPIEVKKKEMTEVNFRADYGAVY